jgi:hypothetical protein
VAAYQAGVPLVDSRCRDRLRVELHGRYNT